MKWKFIPQTLSNIIWFGDDDGKQYLKYEKERQRQRDRETEVNSIPLTRGRYHIMTMISK